MNIGPESRQSTYKLHICMLVHVQGRTDVEQHHLLDQTWVVECETMRDPGTPVVRDDVEGVVSE